MIGKFIRSGRHWLKESLFNDYSHMNKSYAQEGEDLIVFRHLNYREIGFFVDIGAHHPKRYSNTYFFYKKGWNGINIDAMPGSMAEFNKYRSRDINLEIGVSERAAELTYYVFNEPALNSFSQEHAVEWSKKKDFEIKSEIPVKTLPLRDILATHLPVGQKIDFMSIDVEGLDLAVINSNDWEKYRPEIVLVEDASVTSLNNVSDAVIVSRMKDLGYLLVSKCFFTLIFKDSQTR